MTMTPEEMKAELERQEVERDQAFVSALNDLCKQYARNVQAVPVIAPDGRLAAEIRVMRVTA